MSPANSCAKILFPLWDRCTLSAEIFLLQDTETDPCEVCGQWQMAGGCSMLSGHGGHLLWWAYALSQEAAKADGRAGLCKEGPCALIVIFFWIEAWVLWWKDTEKGKGSCISLLLLWTGPQPIFTSGTGLWSMKTKLAIWQTSGYWICFHWNVEWDRTSLPPCSHWLFHHPLQQLPSKKN